MAKKSTSPATTESPEETPKAPQSVDDLLPQDEDDQDDSEILAALTSDDGKLKVDLDLPFEYQEEVMASQLLEQLTSYQQARQTWRAARNQSDRKRQQDAFGAMKNFQLTAALIQHDFPQAKRIADEIATFRAKSLKDAREAALEPDD